MKFEFKEHTHKGLVREVNEDNMGHALNSPNGDVFVVCDGMGGHVGGKTASTIGVNAIISELTQKEHGNMHVAISDALLFANEQVLGRGESDSSLKGMGSTATVALIKDDLLYIGHVGDSRVYVFSDGKLFRVTRDDSYVQGLVDNGTITEDEAEIHPHRNRILQALGSKTLIKPRIPSKPFKLKVGDILMLCSDGLTSMVIDDFIEQLINPNDLNESVQKLHDIAMTNGGKDNITISLVKITESPFSTSEFEHFTLKYKGVRSSQRQEVFESTLVPNVVEKKKNPLVLIVSVLLTLGVAFGSYLLFFKGNEDESIEQKTNIETNSPTPKKPQATDANNNNNNKLIIDNSDINQVGNNINKVKDKENKPKDEPNEITLLEQKYQAAQKKVDDLLTRYGNDGGLDCTKCQEDELQKCRRELADARSAAKKAKIQLQTARRKKN
jgi:serine/threonine protein phosphatase PrpC